MKKFFLKFLNPHIFIKKKMYYTIIFALSISTTYLLSSCSSGNSEKEEKIKFIVTSPIKQDTLVIRNYVCQIRAIQHIELRALEEGYLQRIYVDEGQYVKEGQMMFQILPVILQAEVQKEEAEVNFAEVEYLNTKRLADSNIVSKNELALAKAKLEKAKASLALAKANYQFTEIKAPFSGIMDHFYARLGSLLDKGDLLTTLSDNSKLWVYFNVPEAEYLNYKESLNKDSVMKVKLLMANNKVFDYPGIVETIEADFNNETGTIQFRATFPNPKGLLRHGETGNIQVNAPYKNALIIPQKATFEVLEKKYVYIVDKNNIAHQKEITIASELPDLYIVKSGIDAGDKIILEGIKKVQDNEKIEYEYKEPKSVIHNLKVYVE